MASYGCTLKYNGRQLLVLIPRNPAYANWKLRTDCPPQPAKQLTLQFRHHPYTFTCDDGSEWKVTSDSSHQLDSRVYIYQPAEIATITIDWNGYDQVLIPVQDFSSSILAGIYPWRICACDYEPDKRPVTQSQQDTWALTLLHYKQREGDSPMLPRQETIVQCVRGTMYMGKFGDNNKYPNQVPVKLLFFAGEQGGAGYTECSYVRALSDVLDTDSKLVSGYYICVGTDDASFEDNVVPEVSRNYGHITHSGVFWRLTRPPDSKETFIVCQRGLPFLVPPKAPAQDKSLSAKCMQKEEGKQFFQLGGSTQSFSKPIWKEISLQDPEDKHFYFPAVVPGTRKCKLVSANLSVMWPPAGPNAESVWVDGEYKDTYTYDLSRGYKISEEDTQFHSFKGDQKAQAQAQCASRSDTSTTDAYFRRTDTGTSLVESDVPVSISGQQVDTYYRYKSFLPAEVFANFQSAWYVAHPFSKSWEPVLPDQETYPYMADRYDSFPVGAQGKAVTHSVYRPDCRYGRTAEVWGKMSTAGSKGSSSVRVTFGSGGIQKVTGNAILRTHVDDWQFSVSLDKANH